MAGRIRRADVWGVVHPVVHSFIGTWWYGTDSLDAPTYLSWLNVTEPHLVDEPDRSLKVATRVRIPLGLPNRRYSNPGKEKIPGIEWRPDLG